MDEDLRALERAAQDPASRIRYAEALLRLDRVADAVAALLPFSDDAEVRRRIGRLELPPVAVTKKPRVRWRTEVPGPPLLEVHASPLGVVVTTRRPVAVGMEHSDTEATVLDAGSGARRPFAVVGRALGIYGHVLLVHRVSRERPRRQAIAALDLSTGEQLWSDEHEATQLGVGLRGVRVALDGTARELAWPYADRPPREPFTGEDATLPLRAATGASWFRTTDTAYGVDIERPGSGDLYARELGGAKKLLWRLELPDARAVAAVGARLYAIRGSEVVCLE